MSDTLPTALGMSIRRTGVRSGGVAGEFVRSGDTVSVYYVGRRADGDVFDSREEGFEPLSVRVGAGQVIMGWDLALLAMRERECLTATIPACLAYGAKGKPPKVPPNAALTFHLEVAEIRRDPPTLLLDTAARGDTSAVRALLAAGVSPLSRDRRGQTALHAAADAGFPETVAAMLEGAAAAGVLGELVDAQAESPNGAGALHLAVRARDETTVALLLHARASAELKTARGKTAADVAGERGLSSIQALLRAGGGAASGAAAGGCVLCGGAPAEHGLGVGPTLCSVAERLRARARWLRRTRNANPRVWLELSVRPKDGTAGAAGGVGVARVVCELWRGAQ